jgi:hypothetical protein
MPPREADSREALQALRVALKPLFDRVMFALFAFAVVMLIILIGSAFMNP